MLNKISTWKRLFLVIAFALISLGQTESDKLTKTFSPDDLDFESILTLSRVIDQLSFIQSRDNTFRNTFGGIFAPDNLVNKENTQILSELTHHFEALRNDVDKRKAAFDHLKTNYSLKLFLPVEYQKEFSNIEKALKSNKNEVHEGYSLNCFTVLNTLLPKLKDILDSSRPIANEQLLEVYFQIKSIEASVAILDSFLSNKSVTVGNNLLTNEEVQNVRKQIADYKKYTQLEDLTKQSSDLKREKYISDYRSARIQYLLSSFSSIESDLNKIYIKLKKIEFQIIDKYKGFEVLAQKEAAQQTKTAQNRSSSFEYNSGEYVDIFPYSQNPKSAKFWIRANVPAGTLKLLDENNILTGIAAKISLVYHVDFKNEANVIPNNNEFIEGITLDQNQVNDLKESLKKVTTEIPLGLYIQNITLKKEKPRNNIKTKFYTPDKTPGLHAITIEMPKEGPWTNYKSLVEEQKGILNSLGLSQELGVEINKVMISPLTFEPQIEFQINSSGIIQQLLNTDTQTFRLNFKELLAYPEDLRLAFKKILSHKVTGIISNVFNKQQNKDLLKNIILADEIHNIEVINQEEKIIGHIDFTPILIKHSNFQPSVKKVSRSRLSFKTEVINGKQVVKLSNPALNYETALRDYLKFYVETNLKVFKDKFNYEANALSKDQLKALSFNISQNVNLSKFLYAYERKAIEGRMWFDDSLNNNLSITIKRSGLEVKGIESFIHNYIVQSRANLVVSQFAQELKKNCNEAFSGNKIVKFLSFDFELKNISDCSNLNTTFIAEYVQDPRNKIELKLDKNGKFQIVSVDAIGIQEKLIDAVKNNLDLNSRYVTIKDPHFRSGNLYLNLWVDVPTLGVTSSLGVIEVAPEAEGGFKVGYKGKSLKSEIQDRIDSEFSNLISSMINSKSLAVNFNNEGDGLAIERLISASILKKKIVVDVSFKFAGNLNVEVKKTEIILGEGINIKLDDIELKNQLCYMESALSKEIVPGLKAHLQCNSLRIYKSPMKISGVFDVEVSNLNFPLKFEITKNKISFLPSFSFALPGMLQIVPPGASSPGLILTGGNATADLENKKVVFGANMTVGVAGTAEAFSKLINMRTILSSYYQGSKFGDFEIQANLILISILDILEGKGIIKMEKGCFHLEASTKGPLRSIIKFDQQVELNCTPYLFRNNMDINLIGFKHNLKISAKTVDGGIVLDGSTSYYFLGASLFFEIGSKLVVNNPLSIVKNANAVLTGKIDIGKFTLGGVYCGVNYYNAALDFTVLGVTLGIGVPNIGDITEGKILTQILSMFDFDPKAALEVLKNPDRIKFRLAPMGIGESAKSNSKSSSNSRDSAVPTSSVNKSSSSSGLPPNTQVVIADEESAKQEQLTPVNYPYFSGDLIEPILDILQYDNKPNNIARTFPNNLKGALKVTNPINNYYWFEYVHRSVTDNIDPQINKTYGYWDYVRPYKIEDSISYLINNKRHSFSRNEPYFYYFKWRLAFSNNNDVFVYTTLKIPVGLENSIEFSRYKIYGNFFSKASLTDVYDKITINGYAIKLHPSGNKADFFQIHELYNDQIKIENIFFPEGDVFKNKKGDKINRVGSTGYSGSKLKDLEKFLDKNFKRIKFLVIHEKDVWVFLIESEINVWVYKRPKSEELKNMFEKRSAMMDSLWFKIDQSILDKVLTNKSVPLSQRSESYNPLSKEEYSNLNIIINKLIREPKSNPIFYNIRIAKRNFQIWGSTDKKINTFIEPDPANNKSELPVDSKGLYNLLGISDMKIDELQNKLKLDKLASSLLVNLYDNKINNKDYFLSSSATNDSLFFISSDYNIKIQTKDTLLFINNRIKNNSYNFFSQLDDGDRFTVASFFNKHRVFFKKVVSLSLKDASSTLKIENEGNRLIAYYMNKDFISVFWEMDNGKLESFGKLPLKRIKSKVQYANSKVHPSNPLVQSINSNYEFEDLIKFMKKGYGNTQTWYRNPDNIQPLFILRP